MNELNDINSSIGAGYDEAYLRYLTQNPSRGTLKVQVYIGESAFPVEEARVIVSKLIERNEYTFYDTVTDKDGIADNLVLPTRQKSLSQSPTASFGVQPYETYDVEVSHPDFMDKIFLNVAVFDGIYSIQPVEMIPSSAVSNDAE